MKKVSIVLATYNGCKYLNEQLDSLLESDMLNELVSEIIISDDNSNDRTVQKIQEYSSRTSLIKLVNNSNGQGVINNFMNGINSAKGDFIMFCDQDDIWLPDKIKTMYDKIVLMEKKYTKDIPLLAFSDLYIVDEFLNITSTSFISFHNIDISRDFVTERLVLNNIVPGCVSIVNKKLIELSKINNTTKWIMHDWWFVLVASSLGKICYVDKPLMLYRQHSSNVVGADKKGTVYKLLRVFTVIKDYNLSLKKRKVQAEQLLSVLNALGFSQHQVTSIKKVFATNFSIAKYEFSKKRKLLALISKL